MMHTSYHLPSAAYSTAKRLAQRPAAYLRGAHNPPLVFAPVHTQHFVSVALQRPPGLHHKLAQRLHTLCHLMDCKQRAVRAPSKALPWQTLTSNVPWRNSPTELESMVQANTLCFRAAGA